MKKYLFLVSIAFLAISCMDRYYTVMNPNTGEVFVVTEKNGVANQIISSVAEGGTQALISTALGRPYYYYGHGRCWNSDVIFYPHVSQRELNRINTMIYQYDYGMR